MYRLTHGYDEGNREQGGGFRLYGVAGAQRTRRGARKVQNCGQCARHRHQARLPVESAGQFAAYRQDAHPRFHQRGGSHHPVRRRYDSGRADRRKPVRLYAHHREHRRREQRERGNRRTQAIRHRRLSVRQDVESHHPCAFFAGPDATGVGECHRLAWQSPERGTGRVPNRLRRHHQIG